MAISHGFSQEEIIHGLTQFKPAFGRTQIETLRSGTIFLKDYYNASPASMKAALKLGREIANKEQKKLFLCLGDMLELGEEEKKYHRDLALDIQKVNPNLVLLFGSRTKLTNEELTAHGAKNVMNFATHEELANKLQTQLNGNEVVLIKGSRSMKMEKILSHLSPSVITNEVK